MSLTMDDMIFPKRFRLWLYLPPYLKHCPLIAKVLNSFHTPCIIIALPLHVCALIHVDYMFLTHNITENVWRYWVCVGADVFPLWSKCSVDRWGQRPLKQEPLSPLLPSPLLQSSLLLQEGICWTVWSKNPSLCSFAPSKEEKGSCVWNI